MSPTPAMLAFWRNPRRICAPETPPIFAVVHAAGSTQPPGYCHAWSVHRAGAERMAAAVGGHVEIVRVEYIGNAA